MRWWVVLAALTFPQPSGAFHIALEALSFGHSTARQREYEHGCTGLASTQMLLLRIQRISDASCLEVCQ